MATYNVKSGDTLSAIAKQYGTTVDAIAKANNISNVNLIKVGQSLSIGSPTTASKPPVAPVSNYDINAYRSSLNNLTANSTPAYIPPKTGLTYTPAPANNQPIPSGNGTIVDNKALKPNGGMPTPTPTPTPTPKPTVPTAGSSYSVVAGDSLSKIAQKNGMTIQQIQALNPEITNPNLIKVGQQIKLSGGGTPAPVVPTGAPQGGQPQYNSPTPTVPLTPQQEAEEMARKAGEAGLSVSEYQSLMGNNSLSKAETDKIAKELGITALEGEVFKKPKQSTQDMFDTAYRTAGLSDLKSKIQKLTDEIDRDRADLAEATGEIDENPFLTETSRVGRGKRVLDQAEKRINNKLAQADTLQKLYDQGISEITSMIARDKEDFGTNQAIDEAKLNYLIKKAEIQATQQISDNSKANTTAYIAGRSSGAEPKLVGNSSTGFFRWDSTTKKFVQVISPENNAPASYQEFQLAQNNPEYKAYLERKANGDANAFKPTSEQKALVGRFLNTAEAKAMGATSDDLTKAMNDPEFFYYLLQLANENGIY